MYNIFVKPNPQQNVSNVFYDICFFDFSPILYKISWILLAPVYSL